MMDIVFQPLFTSWNLYSDQTWTWSGKSLKQGPHHHLLIFLIPTTPLPWRHKISRLKILDLKEIEVWLKMFLALFVIVAGWRLLTPNTREFSVAQCLELRINQIIYYFSCINSTICSFYSRMGAAIRVQVWLPSNLSSPLSSFSCLLGLGWRATIQMLQESFGPAVLVNSNSWNNLYITNLNKIVPPMCCVTFPSPPTLLLQLRCLNCPASFVLIQSCSLIANYNLIPSFTVEIFSSHLLVLG